MSLQGITAYSYAPITDGHALKSAGYVFAMYKGTEGIGYKDLTYPKALAECVAAAVALSPFHFFHPIADPVIQARFFFNYVGIQSLAPSIDFEEDDGQPATATAKLVDHVQEVRALFGVWPYVYSNPSFWSEHYALYLRSTNAPFDFTLCGLMIANWGAISPRIPAPWKDWAAWQDAKEISGVPGVNGHPDHMLWNGALPIPGGSSPAPAPPDAVDRLWRRALLEWPGV
jgi:GH25 family lysozyme M1 (1,4-beta-N-acetylmuramidase)